MCIPLIQLSDFSSFFLNFPLQTLVLIDHQGSVAAAWRLFQEVVRGLFEHPEDPCTRPSSRETPTRRHLDLKLTLSFPALAHVQEFSFVGLTAVVEGNRCKKQAPINLFAEDAEEGALPGGLQKSTFDLFLTMRVCDLPL